MQEKYFGQPVLYEMCLLRESKQLTQMPECRERVYVSITIPGLFKYMVARHTNLARNRQ